MNVLYKTETKLQNANLTRTLVLALTLALALTLRPAPEAPPSCNSLLTVLVTAAWL